METVKRLFISLIVLFGCTAGSWAIEQDSDGYYLIGSVQDWKDFAGIVLNTNQAANARMTADINLGDDQTRIGDVAGNEYGAKFGGIFDGQGHTLTVAYNITGQNMCAPFTKTNGATIKNLHVAGTMRTEFCHLAGIIADAYGKNTIENVWVSADLTSANNYNSGGRILDLCGAFVGCKKTGTLSISNGLFSGSITTENGSIWNGAFLGYIDGENQSSATITNCLSVGTFSYFEHETTIPNRGTNTYCYVKQFPTTIPSEMQVTDEQLANGTIVEALGNGWVQDPLTKQPTLKIFATLKQDADDYYLIGSVQDWKNFAELVNSGTNPAANAKMIADVDLGDDQTMVGTYHQKYQGTFDGQGHTLTFNYDTEGMSFEPEQRDLSLDFLGAAPFRDIEGATICNLHTAGSVTAEKIGASGLVGWTYGTNTIENCWSDVDIVSSNNTADTFAGFVAFQYGTQLNITDCVYTGKIQSASNISHAGFVAFQRYGKSSLNNCLLLLDEGSDVNTTTTQGLKYYTFVRNFESHNVANTINNCYYLTPFGVAQGTQTTDGDISDGTTAAALQADRSEEIWVQDPVLGIPMLKLFAKDLTYTVPSSGYGTFSAKGKVLLPEGLTAHYCKTYNAERSTIGVVNISGNVVPAATGVLLKGTVGETYTLTGATTEAPVIEGNALVAVTEATHVEPTAGEFTNFMMKSGEFKQIAAAAETSKMPANRAYLQIATSELPTGAAGAREITILWDDTTTGITSLTPVIDGNYYTISGVKLQNEPSQKGIYIVNGKKVIK